MDNFLQSGNIQGRVSKRAIENYMDIVENFMHCIKQSIRTAYQQQTMTLTILQIIMATRWIKQMHGTLTPTPAEDITMHTQNNRVITAKSSPGSRRAHHK